MPPKSEGSMHQRGFTLVELLVVVAIMGLLFAIAYPHYASFVVKARRTEAQAALLAIMQDQERYFTRHNTYLAFSADTGDGDAARFKWWSGSSAAASAYELRGQACAGQTIARCIALDAIPGTDRVDRGFRDTDCHILTLTSVGEQRASGGAMGCWP